MTSRKKRRVNYQHVFYALAVLLLILLLIYGIFAGIRSLLPGDTKEVFDNGESGFSQTSESDYESSQVNEASQRVEISYPKALNVLDFKDDIVSQAGVVIDITDNQIIAGRDYEKIIYPASMTKVMTLIVAAENIGSLEDTFTMTYDIIAPLVDQEASRAGFDEGETVTMEDLLYGAALPSGADATVALAVSISGSEEKFVELMNEKALEIGLENTHFMNTSGLHHENHYSTAVEMGMIMEYAMKNDLCREVLSTYMYTTSKTKEHPEGIELVSTMFSRMYGDEVVGADIVAGKTGYTDEAQNCLVTYGTKNGKEYVTVTTLSYDYWLTIHDAFNLYAGYIKPETEIVIVPE